MDKHEVYFNNGTKLVRLNQESDVKGVNPPIYYPVPELGNAWLQLIQEIPKFKKNLFEHSFNINLNDKS